MHVRVCACVRVRVLPRLNHRTMESWQSAPAKPVWQTHIKSCGANGGAKGGGGSDGGGSEGGGGGREGTGGGGEGCGAFGVC